MAKLLTTDLVSYLRSNMPNTSIFSNTTDKNKPCIGIFKKGDYKHPETIGSLSSTDGFDFTVLVRVSEDANTTENTANTAYDYFNRITNITINGKRISSMSCLTPVMIIGRDEKNLVEATFRVRVIYER